MLVPKDRELPVREDQRGRVTVADLAEVCATVHVLFAESLSQLSLPLKLSGPGLCGGTALIGHIP